MITENYSADTASMFPVELVNGMKENFCPPLHILDEIRTVTPVSWDGKPALPYLRIWSAGVGYSFFNGRWNAQALCEGTEARN